MLTDKIPFPITQVDHQNHILNNNKPLFITSKIQRVELKLDSSSVVSDVFYTTHLINKVENTKVVG